MKRFSMAISADAATATQTGRLYRRLWRWHFYAGLICLPFLISLAVTGALYLFRNEIEDVVYRQQLFVVPPADAAHAALLSPQRLVDAALAARPGVARAWTGPSAPDRAAQVDVAADDGVRQVFVDPYTGRVTGSIDSESRLMTVVKHIHSLALIGDGAKYVIEAVAGWLLVLVSTGLYLWWPRGRWGGALTIRATPASRLWWRDIHAVCGLFAAVALVFLALTGMPWSVFWGSRVNRALTDHGLGVPAAMWRQVPRSAVPTTALGDVPWTMGAERLPVSDEHAGHEGHEGHGPGAAPMVMADKKTGPGLGLDQAEKAFRRLGLPAGYRLSLPGGPAGVYTATVMPDAVAGQRIVHLDRYSGRVMADIAYADFGPVAKVTEWGVSVHKGREYGRLNQYVLLLACLMLIFLAASGVLMYWRRRPRGKLAAPPRRDGDTVGKGIVVIGVVLGIMFPVLGASMLLALAFDRLASR
jgi:uncharacterized iron-regulated membrane protein